MVLKSLVTIVAVPLTSFRLNPATLLLSLVAEFAAPARITVAPLGPERVPMLLVPETGTRVRVPVGLR